MKDSILAFILGIQVESHTVVIHGNVIMCAYKQYSTFQDSDIYVPYMIHKY